MSFKIPCGGFRLNEESFSLDENGVLSVKNDTQVDEDISWDDIKDRPFYEEPILKDFILDYDDDTTRLTFTAVDNGEGNGVYLVVEPGTATADTPARNKTYIVEFDGVVYEVETTEDEIEGWAYIGNPFYYNLDAESNGLPFLFCSGEDNTSEPSWYLFTKTPGEHTIQIWQKTGENIKTLDLKYLPEQLQIGEETVEKVILDNVRSLGGPVTDVPAEYADENGNLKVSAMVPGDTYIAIVDGIEYRDVCREVADETSDGGIGIEVFPSPPTEEIPVSLTTYGNNVYISFYPDDMQARTVTLIHLAKEITTLDPKFLPKADAVADVSAAPTAEEFNALLAALREAGYLAE